MAEDLIRAIRERSNHCEASRSLGAGIHDDGSRGITRRRPPLRVAQVDLTDLRRKIAAREQLYRRTHAREGVARGACQRGRQREPEAATHIHITRLGWPGRRNPCMNMLPAERRMPCLSWTAGRIGRCFMQRSRSSVGWGASSTSLCKRGLAGPEGLSADIAFAVGRRHWLLGQRRRRGHRCNRGDLGVSSGH